MRGYNNDEEMKFDEPDIPPDQDLDLLVIGAGPHALSLLTRLVDPEPDLLTERQRNFTMIRAKNARSKAVVREHLKKRFKAERLKRTLVVDSHGKWMAQWALDFKALGISYLRSHQHMHPCPFDFQSLQVWAEMKGRAAELQPMDQVDRDNCRKAGYFGPYVVPSSQLFLDFCSHLVDSYDLGPLISTGTVEDIRVLDLRSNVPRKFEVRLGDGRRFIARRVVCSVGPGPAFRAELPQWAQELTKTASSDYIGTRVKHSSSLTQWLVEPENEQRLADAKVLIIGGGQTAAHLALRVLKCPGSTVTLCTRRRIQQKMFDVDTKFVGDKRPSVLKQFWKLQEPKQRLSFNAALRGGGSMSSDVYAKLVEFTSIPASSGRLQLMQEAEVEQAHWLLSPEDEHEGDIHVRFDNGCLMRYDYVWLATGGDFDLDIVPMFSSLAKQRPIDMCFGLPVLREDLSWDQDFPLYIMGAYAQLQLGADALNLAGARSGGALVARTILEHWNRA